MSKMISVASGFQYSVNIGYDLSSNEKLKNFIPTKSSLGLLEEILLSTAETSTERSRVLIGAYGKGKSHIVLTILSILMKRDLRLFEKLLPKLEEHPKLKQCVLNYYESPNKILPVVITGSNTSLSQAFLLALQRTLSDNDLLDVMPETNYKAAISVIERWEKDCIAVQPDIVCFMIGINDVWHSYAHGLDITTEEYSENCRRMLEALKSKTKAGLVVMEPFLLDNPEKPFREKLDPDIDAIRALSREYADILVPLDGMMTAAAIEYRNEDLTFDGVHPKEAGARLIGGWASEAIGKVIDKYDF